MRRYEYARCEICNATGSSEIATHDEDIGSGIFYMTATGFICSECEHHHKEIMSDWDIIDELDEDDMMYEEYEE